MQCQPIRNDLAACLLQTDCVKNGKSGQECLQNHMDELPNDCQVIYKSYVNCRRGLVRYWGGCGRKSVSARPADLSCAHPPRSWT